MELRITEDYLDEVCNFSGRKIVGILMKRIDLLDSKKALKSVIKELVYEQMREIKSHIKAFNEGTETTFYNFEAE